MSYTLYYQMDRTTYMRSIKRVRQIQHKIEYIIRNINQGYQKTFLITFTIRNLRKTKISKYTFFAA